MTDADGDGVWEATIPLLSGSYEQIQQMHGLFKK